MRLYRFVFVGGPTETWQWAGYVVDIDFLQKYAAMLCKLYECNNYYIEWKEI